MLVTAQPEMYDAWCALNLSVDAPGATSADVASLGHSVAHTSRRPLYPIAQDVSYKPGVETFTVALD